MDTNTNLYADRIKSAMGAMRGKRGGFGHFTISDLSRGIATLGGDVSYEFLRQIINDGKLTISEDVNTLICSVLGLDVAEMQKLLNAEKLRSRFDISAKLLAPRDTFLKKNWDFLTADQKDELRERAQKMLTMNARQTLRAAS